MLILEKKLNELYTQSGKEYANFNIPMSSSGLYNFMFEKNEFFEPFWISRKFYGELNLRIKGLRFLTQYFFKDISCNDWEKIGKYKTRRLEYTMEGPVVGSKYCKTVEIEVK